MGEHLVCNQVAAGPNPVTSTMFTSRAPRAPADVFGEVGVGAQVAVARKVVSLDAVSCEGTSKKSLDTRPQETHTYESRL